MVCPTGKHTYPSVQAAERALKRIRRQVRGKGGGQHKRPERAYLCEFGSHWHLTSEKIEDREQPRLR